MAEIRQEETNPMENEVSFGLGNKLSVFPNSDMTRPESSGDYGGLHFDDNGGATFGLGLGFRDSLDGNFFGTFNSTREPFSSFDTNLSPRMNEEFPSYRHFSPMPSLDKSSSFSRPYGFGLSDAPSSAVPIGPDLALPNLQDVMEEDVLAPHLNPTPTGLSATGGRGYLSCTSFGERTSKTSPRSPLGVDLSPSLEGLTRNSSYSNFLPSEGDYTAYSTDDMFSSSLLSSRNSLKPAQFGFHEGFNKSGPSFPYPTLYSDQSPRGKMGSNKMNESGNSQRNNRGYGNNGGEGYKRVSSNSSKGSWTKGDIRSYRGHINEMARDHNGCRLLQQCLMDSPEKAGDAIYEEVRADLVGLMIDPFGNYLFQKLLDVSSPSRKREVLNQVKDSLVAASYNVHGTRSVQNLIQTCRDTDMVTTLLSVLKGNIAKLSSHANGNHVIQRCLQCLPDPQRALLYEEVIRSCVEISTHRHGCCVVQRCLSSANPADHAILLDTILENAMVLICDPFGNYVIQYLIENDPQVEVDRLAACVLGKIVALSCQKYSSNVIEKLLSCTGDAMREKMFAEIANSPKLGELLHHDFANYVVQKALQLSGRKGDTILIDAIKPYESELNRSTGGRHILAQLSERREKK